MKDLFSLQLLSLSIEVHLTTAIKTLNITNQREVTHRVNDNPLILVHVLSDPPQSGLHNVVSIQKLLLSTRFQPDLVLQQQYTVQSII